MTLVKGQSHVWEKLKSVKYEHKLGAYSSVYGSTTVPYCCVCFDTTSANTGNKWLVIPEAVMFDFYSTDFRTQRLARNYLLPTAINYAPSLSKAIALFNPSKEEPQTMTQYRNHSATIALVSEKVRAVSCRFSENSTTYTYKSLCEDIQVGDYVYVEAADSRELPFAICKVTSLDEEFEFDSGINYKWLIGKLDIAEFENLVKQEKQMIEKIKQAERNKKRKELRESLIQLEEDEVVKLNFIDSVNEENPEEA